MPKNKPKICSAAVESHRGAIKYVDKDLIHIQAKQYRDYFYLVHILQMVCIVLDLINNEKYKTFDVIIGSEKIELEYSQPQQLIIERPNNNAIIVECGSLKKEIYLDKNWCVFVFSLYFSERVPYSKSKILYCVSTGKLAITNGEELYEGGHSDSSD
jgi:hypothetical protein